MNFIGRSKLIRCMSSLVRQNFANECEKAINKQINMELQASYEYLSMAYFFDRSDVALPGLHKHLKKCSGEEQEHAEKLMKYLNKRGGSIVLECLQMPKPYKNQSAKNAMDDALSMEKKINESLLELHSIATKAEDPNLCDFIESEFLQEQVDAIKEIASYIRQIERCEKELGAYVFDISFNSEKPH